LSAKSYQPFAREDQGLTVFPEEPSVADSDADDDDDVPHFREVTEAALKKNGVP
jgi:hypothetical protein